MYTFHASLPLSLPPPVSFSPPNAPPISAPDVPMLTLTMPQSDPSAETNLSASAWSEVKTLEERCKGLLLDDWCLLVDAHDARPGVERVRGCPLELPATTGDELAAFARGLLDGLLHGRVG